MDRDEADLVDDWWYCEDCMAHYQIHYNGDVNVVCLDARVKNHLYSLQLMYDSGESRIVAYPEDPEGTLIIVVSFPYILIGVTPQNVADKIRTYINFS
jgi:hypothetical protein